MDPINIPPLFMLAYIAAPWIRHGILLKIWINNRENILYYILLYIYTSSMDDMGYYPLVICYSSLLKMTQSK